MEKEWVELYRSSSPEEIDILKNMLESHGIGSVAINQRDSAYLSFGDVTLYVKNTDFVRARGLLDNQHND